MKVLEGYKRESPQFKRKVLKIEGLYVRVMNELGKKVDFGELRKRFEKVLDGEEEEGERKELFIEEVRE